MPVLFGTFAAWVLLSMLASQQRELSNLNVYAAVGAFGGAVMLVLSLVGRWIAKPASAAGLGCFYSAAAFIFMLPLLFVVVQVTGRGVTVYGWGPVVLVHIAYIGLGIVAGVGYTRFVRAETERQSAALAQQQLEIARTLQERLLPPTPVTHRRYVADARNIPAIYVAGDFYDFIPLPNERLLIVIGDVAGKGVGAGLIMASTKAMIPLLAAREEHVAPLMGRLNEQLMGKLGKRDFVACVLALYDSFTGALSIANAGLPDPVVVSRTGERRSVVLPGPRYPLGVRANLSYESVTVRLHPGDRAVLLTDGLPEAVGYERLDVEIGATGGDLAQLFAAVESVAPGPHDDDWTAVSLSAL
jgi:hypothetical protein